MLLLILGSAILIALYVLATIRSGNSKAAFVATAAVFVLATPSFNLRPQMLGYLFLILTLIALERFRQGHRRAVWALPILMMIWVNAHRSWIIGLGVIGIYLASGLVEFRVGRCRSLAAGAPPIACGWLAVLLLCACATLITPYGAGLAKYPFEVAFSLPLGVANVVEWLPMPFGAPLGKLFLLALSWRYRSAAHRSPQMAVGRYRAFHFCHGGGLPAYPVYPDFRADSYACCSRQSWLAGCPAMNGRKTNFSSMRP